MTLQGALATQGTLLGFVAFMLILWGGLFEDTYRTSPRIAIGIGIVLGVAALVSFMFAIWSGVTS